MAGKFNTRRELMTFQKVNQAKKPARTKQKLTSLCIIINTRQQWNIHDGSLY